MTREELLRILKFVDSNREISEKRTPLATVDPRWNIISYAVRRHLEGKLTLVSSAALAAEVPYGTAMRRISELIDEGLLHKRPRSETGRSFSLHPTAKLITEFESFAMQLKSVVGTTFGFNTGDSEIGDFYFGGYYMASRILPYPSAMRSGIGKGKTFRILSPKDPTFKTLSEFSSNLDEFCGGDIEIVNLPLDELHGEIMKNAERPNSRYDLIAVDLPWIGQLATQNIIEPINDVMQESRHNPSDFHNAAFRGSSWQGKQYGLPIQPTAELLFYRSDLFSEAGLPVPRTTDDILFAARVLHRSSLNLSGIVMNYGRGTPLAHTFIQTLADFGQPIINLRRLGDDFDVTEIEGENYRPQLDTETARDAAKFLIELAQFSHKESMVCDWDRRIRIFAKGHAAMTYGWSIRAAAFELDETSPAHNNVKFVAHPHGPGARTVSPIGGFSLAIPAKLDTQRRKTSWKVMEYLTRPELLKWYVLNGNLTSPRFSTSADPEVQASSALIGEVDAMERRGELQTWPRPPIPEFSNVLSILGDEIFMMLQGEATVDGALRKAQTRIDTLMRENGHY
ncbi:extracellular solute-binding protein [Loktanella sp. IMCC34160]|uniref:extracellular solute-binding protein n=1 Tax=Loktanella sp. IMCC34160 TaxID=2510646 RepID=UPI00101C45DC|nr:extracellular solute-binding protein [Loktanella sp. IMCC34160]RYG89281.1 extracellular solute-binding protein [Loktanella sp. IMCC34160]